jgi:hypothetical protein
VETAFYSTSAQAAFALLGLWWVVVAERRTEWRQRSSRRRQAYTVSMYFMLPGIMSLGSLVSSGQTTVWRLTFGIAGALGVLETVAGLRETRSQEDYRGRVGALLGLTFPFYLLVVVVALHTTVAADVGINLKPLETEAVVVSALLFLGVNFAWLLFFERHHEPTSTG